MSERERQLAREAEAEQLAATWNAAHPIGTRVRFWHGRSESPKEACTRTPAEVSGGTVQVYMEGHYHPFVLSELWVVDEEEKR